MTNARLKVAITLAFLTLAGLFVTFWDVYFNSDYAMIGLMAKAINEYGERPIYVWSVGYMGMLFDGYALAALFKLVGQNVYVLHLWPALILGLALVAYQKVARVSLGERASLWATLFLVASTPAFYGLAARTVPNYGNTLLFGLLFTTGYLKLLRRHFIERLPFDRESFFILAGMGFLAGFGYYTYAQISYFLAAVGGHLALVALRLHQPFTKPLKVLTALALVVFTFGLLSYVSNITQMGPVKWEAFSTLRLGVQLLILFFGLNLLWSYRTRLKTHASTAWRGLFIFLAPALIGYSPQLYFKYVQGGDAFNRSRLGVSFPEFLTHLQWAWTGVLNFINVTYTKTMIPDLLPEAADLTPLALRIAVGLIIGLVILRFLGDQLSVAWRFVSGRAPAIDVMKVSPLTIVMPVVWLAFGLAPIVMGLPQARYTMPVVLTFALALGWVVPKLSKRTAALFVLVVLMHNGFGFYRKLQEHHGTYVVNEVADYLKSEGITRGYGDFWYAYVTNFLTNEAVIIEPIREGYNPRYAPLVAEAEKIAYLDAQSLPETMEIRGQAYQKRSERRFDSGLVVTVLTKR